MHELSLAMAMIEQVQDVQREQRARAVVCVKLSMGALSGVDREAFTSVFSMAAEGTGLEHARLEIQEVPAEITCEACGYVTRPGRMFFHCGNCGSPRVRITAGRDFRIISVELQVDDVRAADGGAPPA